MKFGKLFLRLLLVLSLGTGAVWAVEVAAPGQAELVAKCGKGALYNMRGQKVLVLKGNHYEMGYQQGKLLTDEVRQLVTTVLMTTFVVQTARTGEVLEGSLAEAYRRTVPYIDERYQQEMRGLADGSGVKLAEIQLANIFPELFHCSGFAVFGKASKDGVLYHGRILDYMTGIGLQNHAVVTVCEPEGFNVFVTVGYAGFIGSVTGMNEKQVAFGEMGGRGEGNWDGMPMSFLMRKGMEESDTLAEAVELFRETSRTCEYYYVISDGKGPDARGLACRPGTFEVVAPGEFHELLPHPAEDAVLLSAEKRYELLAQRVADGLGKIDLMGALELMDRPVAMKSALHCVLFEPATLKFWVANAAREAGDKQAAPYQVYYGYDLNELRELLNK